MSTTATATVICDGIAALLEPVAGNRDDSRKAPRGGVEWVPGLTYLWPVRSEFTPEGDGSLDRHVFTLRMAWVAEDILGQAGGDPDRTVSDALAARVLAVRAVVASHRTGATWDALAVTAADYDSLATAEVRGVYIDLAGYALIS